MMFESWMSLIRGPAARIAPIAVLISILAATPALAAPAGAEQETQRPRGRDIVRLGEFGTITGVLEPQGGEWFLVAGGVKHELHLGDHDHRKSTGLSLAEGKTATVTGFVLSQGDSGIVDVAVCAVVLDGREYRFRTDDGTPLWRGKREGRGRGAAER